MKRSTLHRCTAWALVGVLAVASGLARAAGAARAVQFTAGASAATLQGTVKGDAFVDHTLRADAGQTMSVSLVSRRAYFNVLPPGSKDVAIYNSSINGNTWSGPLDQAGVYTVRVYLMRNEARRGTTAPYTLTVGITGAGHGRDAKVAGTAFHATGSLPCTLGTEAKSCAFGVVRSGRGLAEVQVTPPGGMTRALKFSGAEVTAPGSRSIQVDKQGDEWSIDVNDVEHYRIPDAVISGG